MTKTAIVSNHKGPVYGKMCGSCGQYWPCATEVAIRIEFAINDLFDAGGPDGSPLPTSCYEAGPWQAPGTVAVRVEALRALAKAAGIATWPIDAESQEWMNAPLGPSKTLGTSGLGADVMPT